MEANKNYAKRNKYAFGLGTVGRDMVYSLVSMYLVVFLTEVLDLPDSTMWWITGIMLIARIYDAFNDPIMGVIVDNTKSRWGKYKPWMALGVVLAGIFTVLLFTDMSLTGSSFIIVFAILYLMWGMSFTANDISYWSMMPSLSLDQKERERIGAFARICANVGLFIVVAGIIPITNALGDALGGLNKGYFVFAIGVVVIMILFQCITLFGVKEPKLINASTDKTTLKGMLYAIVKNDQLLFTAISMALFMIGYDTTTSFGVYFFKYAYGNEDMYSIFAIVLGVSQIAALLIFPLISKKISRKKFYTISTVLVLVGYLLFFFSPMDMLFIGAAGILMFIGQAFIQLLMLMFLADTIEYGQWKLGKRNDSVTFSLQPFINKMGGAVGSAIVSATVIISGINAAKTAADVTPEGLLIMKSAMLLLPLIFILVGYILYRWKYKIDEKLYGKILADLKDRGEINVQD